jgi:hypothetical protein
MIPAAAGFVLSLSTVGCGHPVQRQLEGRWFGDSIENFAPGELSAATGWARGLSFEFSGAALTVAIPAEEPRTGAYRVTSVHHNDVRLAVDRKDGKKDAVRLKLDDDRSLRWMLDETRAIVLRRED